LNSTGTAAGVAHVTGSGTAERTVTISSISGDGTLGLSLRAGTAPTTLAPGLGDRPERDFTVDNTAPAITGVSALKLRPQGDETALVTVTFSEPVASFDSSDFTEVDNGRDFGPSPRPTAVRPGPPPSPRRPASRARPTSSPSARRA